MRASLLSRLYRPRVPQPGGGSGWGLDSQLWTGGSIDSSSGAAASGIDSGGITGLAWRPPSAGVPPMLLVSGPTGAAVWWHDAARCVWAESAQLPGPPASAVAWAPLLGRPADLVAAAAGRDITVWSLEGRADALEVGALAMCVRELSSLIV